jgi:hypothetical protein
MAYCYATAFQCKSSQLLVLVQGIDLYDLCARLGGIDWWVLILQFIVIVMISGMCLVPRIQQRFALGVVVSLSFVTVLLVLTADRLNFVIGIGWSPSEV